MTDAGPWLLALSEHSPERLKAAAADLGAVLSQPPGLPLGPLAASLARRPARQYRLALVAADPSRAAQALLAWPETSGTEPVITQREACPQTVVFLLPGVGELRPGAVAGLYRRILAFRIRMDDCAEHFRALLGMDIRQALDLDGVPLPPARMDLSAALGTVRADPALPVAVAQPLAWTIEFALAGVLADAGLRPDAVVGYSIGECVAMCLAGVAEADDVRAFVAQRATAIAATPAGAMAAVALGAAELGQLLAEAGHQDLCIAAVDGTSLCTVAGPGPAVDAIQKILFERGVASRRVPVDHAFHSSSMAAAQPQVRQAAAAIPLSAPRIKTASNLTGDWLSPAEATSPDYWASQVVGTVDFAANLRCAWRLPAPFLVEAGPGRGLTTLAVTHQDAVRDGLALPTLQAAGTAAAPDVTGLLTVLATAWVQGLPIALELVAGW